MSTTESELYNANVPFGKPNIEDTNGDWSSAQSTITLTNADPANDYYISSIDFVISDDITSTSGAITLAHSAAGEFSYSLTTDTAILDRILAIADKETLKMFTYNNDTNFIGEIRFNPPLVVSNSETFTITDTTMVGFSTTTALFNIRYWIKNIST